MWVNLGCGDYYVPGWHNVDCGSPYPTDEVVDITGPLPWQPGEVTRAYMGHLLEHLTVEDGTALLTRLHEITAPGGDVMAVGPDVVRAEMMFQLGALTAEDMRLIKYGGNRWPGDQHLWFSEPRTIERMMAKAGWQNVQEIPVECVSEIWPLVNRSRWQCAVQALRRSGE